MLLPLIQRFHISCRKMADVVHCCLRRLPNLTLLLLNLVTFASLHSELPLLLLISMDGFRWDYLRIAKQNGFQTPTFDQLIANGVTIGEGGLKNVFITKTYPNHFTLVTGLYPENHGVVANMFSDPKFNESFDPNKPWSEDRKWWDGKSADNGKGVEPIWMSNDRQGGHRASGSYMWPDSVVDNQRPFYTRTNTYKTLVDASDAVKSVVGWFVDDLKPINLGLLYFDHADHIGHYEGAGSMKVLETVQMLDGALKKLLDCLETHDLFDRMNIILTSDHGMINMTKTIYLDEFVNPGLYTNEGQSPVWMIRPLPGKEEEVYNGLKKVPNLDVYKKEEIPDDLHFRHNRRIFPILIIAYEGYRLCSNQNSSECRLDLIADHGYSSSLTSMHPIFIAHGPAFKRNYTSPPINNVDLYPLMCHILGVPPHPNDGNFDNIRHILVDEGQIHTGSISAFLLPFLASVGFTACISGICCTVAFRLCWIYTHRSGRFFRRLNPSSLDVTQKDDENKHPLLESEEDSI